MDLIFYRKVDKHWFWDFFVVAPKNMWGKETGCLKVCRWVITCSTSCCTGTLMLHSVNTVLIVSRHTARVPQPSWNAAQIKLTRVGFYCVIILLTTFSISPSLHREIKLRLGRVKTFLWDSLNMAELIKAQCHDKSNSDLLACHTVQKWRIVKDFNLTDVNSTTGHFFNHWKKHKNNLLYYISSTAEAKKPHIWTVNHWGFACRRCSFQEMPKIGRKKGRVVDI